MKKIYLLVTAAFLCSCTSSRYVTVPLGKGAERQKIAADFVETYLNKCSNKDYSAFEGFNISAKFNSRLQPDSLKRSCERIAYSYGKVKVEKLVSVHSRKSPRDFIDVFNFKITTEKKPEVRYLHLGMYRDQNYLEVPFYFNKDENYLDYRKKKK